MESPFIKAYPQRLWESYARAVSLISVLGVVICFVVGGYDLLKLVAPEFTLNSALREKYKTNDSYTEFRSFKKDLPEERLTYERTENYQKLLRIERQNALQRLVKVVLALLIIVLINWIFILTSRRRKI